MVARGNLSQILLEEIDELSLNRGLDSWCEKTQSDQASVLEHQTELLERFRENSLVTPFSTFILEKLNFLTGTTTTCLQMIDCNSSNSSSIGSSIHLEFST